MAARRALACTLLALASASSSLLTAHDPGAWLDPSVNLLSARRTELAPQAAVARVLSPAKASPCHRAAHKSPPRQQTDWMAALAMQELMGAAPPPTVDAN